MRGLSRSAYALAGLSTRRILDVDQEELPSPHNIVPCLVCERRQDGLKFLEFFLILASGYQAAALLDSFNTGHAGSLATIHSNSAEKALHRFANLVTHSHALTTFSDTEAEIGEAVEFVVHVERQPGRRVIREVLALRGYDRDTERFLIDPVYEVNHGAA